MNYIKLQTLCKNRSCKQRSRDFYLINRNKLDNTICIENRSLIPLSAICRHIVHDYDPVMPIKEERWVHHTYSICTSLENRQEALWGQPVYAKHKLHGVITQCLVTDGGLTWTATHSPLSSRMPKNLYYFFCAVVIFT